MNPKWFGDSYDIVKRFFIGVLRGLGYDVYVEPMFTGDWGQSSQRFYDFLNVQNIKAFDRQKDQTALFVDPDKGVRERPSRHHAAIGDIITYLDDHEIVFVFDQSFSWSRDALTQMREKLSLLNLAGAYGFYYDSHARFLFTSKSESKLAALQNKITESGLPEKRLIHF